MKEPNSGKTEVCHPAPTDKRKYISDIGKILVRKHGKKKYYRPAEVKDAHKESSWAHMLDFSCWAMSAFSSHRDFDAHHAETGEACDYASMKAEMLEGISLTDSPSPVDLSAVDLDASWLDLGPLLEGILEGIGEFFAEIVSGL